ncbi:MAG: hypothetical protein ABSD56_01940 [Bryobacteraceae bacterium]
MEDPEYRRLYAKEGLVADAAELVAGLLKKQKTNKAQLARQLGKSRAWVTQLLSGKANMTIRTFAEVVYALGAEVKLSAQPQMAHQDQTTLLQQWADPFEMPCRSGPWKVASEIQFAFSDLNLSVWAKQKHVEGLERREYAA